MDVGTWTRDDRHSDDTCSTDKRTGGHYMFFLAVVLIKELDKVYPVAVILATCETYLLGI